MITNYAWKLALVHLVGSVHLISFKCAEQVPCVRQFAQTSERVNTEKQAMPERN